MDSHTDDFRYTELETLEAIYPEIQRPDPKTDPFTFDIELPVQPAVPVTVIFLAAAGNDVSLAATDHFGQPEVDSLHVTHLPALSLRITLPDGYPADRPPIVRIFTEPLWLPQEIIENLESDGPRLWEECGRDMVAYTYIDHVQRAVDDVFGAITPDGTLEMDSQHKLAVLDHDIKAKKAAFENETFDCGICLDPKRGSKCHRMLDCGHIFCLQCLQDFYNHAIKDGNLSTVRCLTPGCAKDRGVSQAKDKSKTRKPKTSISPSELLQIGLTEETVKRYVTLKYKTELESDKNTVYCPRQWCNGAARSKKHKKPSGLDFADVSDPESDDEKEDHGDKKGKKSNFNRADLLAVCEDCSFAFCNRCFQTWHGEFYICAPRRQNDELTEEEKASLAYLKLHTSPCPTCNAPAQKTHGCNHMICSRCESHFCYLCSAWLDPTNPYRHYNEQANGKVTSCYMRLWELEGGDGDDVGLDFGGGHGANGNLVAPRDAEDMHLVGNDADIDALEDEELAGDDLENEEEQPEEPPNAQVDRHGRPIAVAREAPLVLRLVNNQPNNARNAVPPAAPEAPPAIGHGQNNPNQGGRRGAAPRARGFRDRGRGARGRQQPDAQRNVGLAENEGGLDAAGEAWVRRFVQMALIDAEDEIDLEADHHDMDDNFAVR